MTGDTRYSTGRAEAIAKAICRSTGRDGLHSGHGNWAELGEEARDMFRVMAEFVERDVLAAAQGSPDRGIAVDPEDLADMLESWADAANYKGDYLREKHGDTESIAAYRAKYFAASTVPSTEGK